MIGDYKPSPLWKKERKKKMKGRKREREERKDWVLYASNE